MPLPPERPDGRLRALRRFTAVQAASVAAKLGALAVLLYFAPRLAGGI